MNMQAASFWEGLSTLQQIYWIIAIPASLLFVFQLVMTFVGGDVDHDLDHDAAISADHGIDFQFLTIKNTVAFFTVFAWSGLACLSNGLPLFWTLLISIVCGLITMLIMATLFYFMSRLAESGTVNMQNAIGKTGEVYLTIPARKSGKGKVQLVVQNALQTLDAVTEDPEDIKTGAMIEVTEVINQNVLVVRRSL